MENNLLPVAWSLTFELWVYLCFTALLGLAVRKPKRLALVSLLFLGLFAWHMAWAVVRRDDWINEQIRLVFFASGLALEFLVGAILGFIRVGDTSRFEFTLGGFACLFIGGGCLVFLDFSLIRDVPLALISNGNH